MLVHRSRGHAVDLLYVAVVLLLATLFAHFVIQSFHGTLLGYTDESIHSFQGDYVLRHLRFVPWPRLDLVNDALFYPYGNDQVFQTWVFERDLFSALCLRFFGLGPWVQIHYLASVLVTALGLFFLLRRAHSQARAAFAGLAVAFCNYYAIAKFPGHANIAVLHWTTLGIAADYLISRRIWCGEGVSGRLLLLRAALLFLALGQDLGYVAGLSLTSFVLTAVWGAFLFRHRLRGSRRYLAVLLRDLRAHPWQTAGLTFALAWGAFFYFPLALQVFLHARKYPVAEILAGHWWQWANPLRIFVPILPGFDPVSSPGGFDRLIAFFGDDPEGFFAMSPGLFFVLFGALGVFLAARRKALGALVPILTLWLLILAEHPAKFPILRLFPWFAYVRTGAKPGDINCLALVLLGIGGIPAGYFSAPFRMAGAGEGPRSYWRPIAGAVLALLFGIEVVTAYRLRLLDDRHYFVPRQDFYRLMDTIRRSPGEAVLEWPFCVASGNGCGTWQFGLYYQEQSTLFALSQFHGKKVVSGYFGRLFPRQVAPFVAAGWAAMFFPDPKAPLRQAHDFDAAQWQFFSDFLRRNDFCGILLSTDFLPAETVRQMHARFGNPVAAAEAGADGRVEFIPRPAAWTWPADPAAGKKTALAAPLAIPGTHIDFTQDSALEYLREGWGEVSNVLSFSGGTTARARLSDGRQARLVFAIESGKAPPPHLTFDLLASAYERQSFTLKFNGHTIQTWQYASRQRQHFLADLPAADWREGVNEITLDLPLAHHPPWKWWKWGRERDARLLGLFVESLDLRQTAAP